MAAEQERWKDAFRAALDCFSPMGIVVVRNALVTDAEDFVQGATTFPPPMQAVREWPCEGACLVGYAGWKGDGLETVGEVEEWFSTVCALVDEALGEPAGCRHLLLFFDETPRLTMRELLLAELDAYLSRQADREDYLESRRRREQERSQCRDSSSTTMTTTT